MNVFVTRLHAVLSVPRLRNECPLLRSVKSNPPGGRSASTGCERKKIAGMAGVPLINIGRSDDPTYRYKMPKLVTRIEGRGNGIRTVNVNMDDVAEALSRSAEDITKVCSEKHQ